MLKQALATGVMVASALSVPMTISSQPANASVAPSAIAAANISNSALTCWSGNSCGTRRHHEKRARKVLVQERVYVEKPRLRRTFVERRVTVHPKRMRRAFVERRAFVQRPVLRRHFVRQAVEHPRLRRAFVERRVTVHPKRMRRA
ncbi:hypothetical protein, partial [Microtetraspora niveoalba]|uniref:hypothetical protein n=1 Tax=Microtetraspora niveoalba TaxID=46175 RepID=UPI000AA97290